MIITQYEKKQSPALQWYISALTNTNNDHDCHADTQTQQTIVIACRGAGRWLLNEKSVHHTKVFVSQEVAWTRYKISAVLIDYQQANQPRIIEFKQSIFVCCNLHRQELIQGAHNTHNGSPPPPQNQLLWSEWQSFRQRVESCRGIGQPQNTFYMFLEHYHQID